MLSLQRFMISIDENRVALEKEHIRDGPVLLGPFQPLGLKFSLFCSTFTKETLVYNTTVDLKSSSCTGRLIFYTTRWQCSHTLRVTHLPALQYEDLRLQR